MLYTAYKSNPFYILDITTRDNRQKIIQMAEDKSLEIDHDICQKARSELTTPKSRLNAELCWFPGISPKRVKDLLTQLELNPYTINNVSGLPNLAFANLLQFALQQIDPQNSDLLASMIEQIVEQTEEMNVHQILRDLNEERSVSGFPEITSDLEAEGIIAEIKRAYVKTIIAKLNEMPANKIVEIMTSITDDSTLSGEVSAPAMIDDLVDDYVIHTQQFLDDESKNIDKLINAITDRASNGEDAISTLVSQLIKITASWDAVAQPIQLSYKTRGIDHEMSHKIGYDIRSLSVDLFNNHDYAEQTKRLNKLLQDYFSELPELLEKVEEDADALADIFQNREERKNKQKEWYEYIRYRAEIGVFFKDVIAIDENQISWKNTTFPLDSITRISWGVIKRTVNFSSDYYYSIRYGDDTDTTIFNDKNNETIYQQIIDRLWKTAGEKIIANMLQKLKKGEILSFNGVKVYDTGIMLYKLNWLSRDEKIFNWNDVEIYSSNGELVIKSKYDKKFSVQISYQNIYNVHFLEQLIRVYFKNPRATKLSDLLS